MPTAVRIVSGADEEGQLIKTGEGRLIYVQMTPPSNADLELKCYDATSDDGDPFLEYKVLEATQTQMFFFARPINFSTGLYVTHEGNNGKIILRYY